MSGPAAGPCLFLNHWNEEGCGILAVPPAQVCSCILTLSLDYCRTHSVAAVSWSVLWLFPDTVQTVSLRRFIQKGLVKLFSFRDILQQLDHFVSTNQHHSWHMERLKLVLQYFQSNSESISNGICIVLALVSVKLYTSFDFNCPCLPQYNKLYSLGVMIIPPIIFFFLGVLVNRHTGVMMDEWMRPIGNRSKNPAVVK